MKNKHLIGTANIMATNNKDGTFTFREMDKVEVVYLKIINWIKNLRWLLIPKDISFVIKDLKNRVEKLEKHGK